MPPLRDSVYSKFIYKLIVSHAGYRVYDDIEKMPGALFLGLLGHMPRNLEEAAPYLEGRARLPPYIIDGQGRVEFELNVPVVPAKEFWIAPTS